jgi:hypothetical protein
MILSLKSKRREGKEAEKLIYSGCGTSVRASLEIISEQQSGHVSHLTTSVYQGDLFLCISPIE